MATTDIDPNADDSGWSVGDYTDLLAQDDGSMDGNAEDAVLVIDFENPGITDDDTVTKVSVAVRAQKTAGSASTCRVGIAIDIGAGPFGAIVTDPLTESWAFLIYTTVLWQNDYTAAELNALKVHLRCDRAGMPSSNVWQVDRVFVRIEYTPAGSGPLLPGLQMAQYQPT